MMKSKGGPGTPHTIFDLSECKIKPRFFKINPFLGMSFCIDRDKDAENKENINKNLIGSFSEVTSSTLCQQWWKDILTAHQHAEKMFLKKFVINN